MIRAAAAVCSILLSGCAASAAHVPTAIAACRETPDDNRRVVTAFYDEALVNRRPRDGFTRYMGADFIEHKPDVPEGTREATIVYLERLIATLPQPRWEVLRTVAEGDLVFLHARFTPAPGAEPYAIADLFRLDHCRIVEHWDVVAGPPQEQRNPNPRF